MLIPLTGENFLTYSGAIAGARCHDKVRYVGEAMAVVVADTAAIAEDALDHIDVEIDPLPAITDRAGAEAAAATLFEQHGSNVAIEWTAVRGDADKAFQSADYVRRETFHVQRHAALFMEPRGIVAEWDVRRIAPLAGQNTGSL